MVGGDGLDMQGVFICRGEDDYWVAECPSLPGCISQGKPQAEAITNIREAIEGWVETAQAHSQVVPEGTFAGISPSQLLELL